MEIKNAIITKAEISIKDHNILGAYLILDFGDNALPGDSCGFGGYALYLPKSFDHHSIESPAGHFIFRCLEIAGVESWKDLIGKAVRVVVEGGKITAVGHVVKNDWFCPKEDFKNIGR